MHKMFVDVNELICVLSVGLIALGMLAAIGLSNVPAPYGKFARSGFHIHVTVHQSIDVAWCHQ
jgi:hypothetical protein